MVMVIATVTLLGLSALSVDVFPGFSRLTVQPHYIGWWEPVTKPPRMLASASTFRCSCLLCFSGSSPVRTPALHISPDLTRPNHSDPRRSLSIYPRARRQCLTLRRRYIHHPPLCSRGSQRGRASGHGDNSCVTSPGLLWSRIFMG
jgi:hypothetical protein